MSHAELTENTRASSLDVSPDEIDRISTEVSRLVREYFTDIETLPVFPRADGGTTVSFVGTELTEDGETIDKLLGDCRTVIQLSRHNGHPRFFGYVASPATPIGSYADLIASALNANVTCWRSSPAATEIEKIVVRWLGSLIGYSDDSRGLLTSGGSMANMIALFAASRRVLGSDTAATGLWTSGAPLVMYVSEEVHMSVPKAADILGFGRNQVRVVECDDRMRMSVAALRRSIADDLATGLRPFCVVASAGTVGTGAVDTLEQIADVAAEFRLWFHVDGAYGAPGALDTRRKELFRGLERADSVSLDPHKWLYVPVDAGGLLFRDDEVFRSAFSSQDAEYIKRHGYAADEAFAFWDYGVELSRRFRALKIWLTLRYYGVRRIAAAISDDISLAAYLGELVEQADDFELMAPVELSICCFRYVPPALTARLRTASESERIAINDELDRLNTRIMNGVQTGGRAYVSNASIRGRFALRACITNFRTTRADIKETLNIIRAAGLE